MRTSKILALAIVASIMTLSFCDIIKTTDDVTNKTVKTSDTTDTIVKTTDITGKATGKTIKNADTDTADKKRENTTATTETGENFLGPYFIAKPCINFTFHDVCPFDENAGCACFANGTCTYETTGNACKNCRKSDVVSYNEGDKCPILGDKKLTVCTNSDPVQCASTVAIIGNVCECDNQGACNYVTDDACNACNKKGMVSVLDGRCVILKT